MRDPSKVGTRVGFSLLALCNLKLNFMAWIYCITNTINGKKYVGKTTLTIEKRWLEHCKDFKKDRCEKRPLYSAMVKYGIDAFSINSLGEYDESEISFYESYWITELNTFKCGYNATLGGDGSILYDYKAIYEEFLKLDSIKLTSEKFNCSVDTVRKVLNLNGYITDQTVSVHQIENDTIINTFEKINDAARWILENEKSKADIRSISSKISAVCKNKRKTAFKYKWVYAKE